MAITQKDPLAQSRALSELGRVYLLVDDSERAISYLEHNIKVCQENGLEEEQMEAYDSLGK